MKKIKTGNKVKHSYLGNGIFIKEIGFMSLVRWDKTPPLKYNMGENPSVIFTNELKASKYRKINKKVGK